MESADEFLAACFSNDLISVQSYLRKGISPNVQNNEGTTPLQIAAVCGYIDLVEILLENNVLVDLANNYGWTPLMHAARHGNTAIVSILLKRKAKVNICNKLGLRPIVAAAWSSQLSTVKLLYEAGAVVDHMPSQNIQGQACDLSSLMASALQGHDSVLRYLLEKGAVVNQASPVTGLTPLMLASCNGHKQIVQVIVEWGGDANRLDICGRTALDVATLRSKRDVKAYLENMTCAKIDSGQSKDLNIFQAVRMGDDVEVESILQRDFHSANTIDPCDGSTPLMLAATLGHLKITQSLVSGGANLNSQDVSNGWTAIMYAVFHRHGEIVSFLVERGADIAIQSLNGYTAIDLARHLDSSETNVLNALITIPDTNLKSQKSLLSTHQFEEHAIGRKSCSSEQSTPIKHHQQARLKSWIGGVSQIFNQKMFTRSRTSNTMSTAPDIQISDSMCEDVFLEPDSSPQRTEGAKLNISTLLSPNKRLSSSLRKQSVEAICPPLLSSPNCDMEFMKLSPINFSHNRSSKKSVSLRTPNLLKGYSRKNSTNNNSESPPHQIVNVPKRSISSQAQLLSVPPASGVDLGTSTQQENFEALAMDNHQMSGELTHWLRQESFQKYVEKFREQEIDLDAFQYLTETDLQEIGINSVGPREKLLDMIQLMKRKE